MNLNQIILKINHHPLLRDLQSLTLEILNILNLLWSLLRSTLLELYQLRYITWDTLLCCLKYPSFWSLQLSCANFYSDFTFQLWHYSYGLGNWGNLLQRIHTWIGINKNAKVWSKFTSTKSPLKIVHTPDGHVIRPEHQKLKAQWSILWGLGPFRQQSELERN